MPGTLDLHFGSGHADQDAGHQASGGRGDVYVSLAGDDLDAGALGQLDELLQLVVEAQQPVDAKDDDGVDLTGFDALQEVARSQVDHVSMH